jgi:hypothetical protein
MGTRRHPPPRAPDAIARIYAEARRDACARQALELSEAGKVSEARKLAKEAAKWEQEARELLAAEEYAQAVRRRNEAARKGIAAAEAGDLATARQLQREAQRWDRAARRLISR